jgi:hypothetical protein
MSKVTNDFGRNMMLLTTYWGNDKTFKLMPVKANCPYMEVIYDPTTDMLVVITTNNKQNLQLVPKLDDDGNQIQCKKPKTNGKPWKEKHTLMTVPQEFYIVEREEMDSFITTFAANAETYEWKAWYKDMEQELSKKIITTPESQPLVDDKGIAIKSKKKIPKLEITK